MLDPIAIISQAEARLLAAKWAQTMPDSALMHFARTGNVQTAVHPELRQLYYKRISKAEETEIETLIMYCGAIWHLSAALVEKALQR